MCRGRSRKVRRATGAPVNVVICIASAVTKKKPLPTHPLRCAGRVAIFDEGLHVVRPVPAKSISFRQAFGLKAIKDEQA